MDMEIYNENMKNKAPGSNQGQQTQQQTVGIVYLNDISEVKPFLISNGLHVGTVVFDGEIHRCPTEDKPHKQNGSYKAYSDQCGGVWRNWRTWEEGSWRIRRNKPLTLSEEREMRERVDSDSREREQIQASRYKTAAFTAQRIYENALECHDHAYLKRKGIKTVKGLKADSDGNLIVPILKDEIITSLQFINGNGDKIFLKGGMVKGCLFYIGDVFTKSPLLICEGLSTGISLYESTGYLVIIAFSAGNLKPVAMIARSLYPKQKIIICADNDAETDSSYNTGVEKANEAALAINGYVAIPEKENSYGF